MDGGSNVGTLLQRRRKPVKIGKEETLLILRAHCSHPTNWSDVLDEVRQNLDQLPEDARALYHSGNLRQLRDRMSGKLSKITKMRLESIQDSDIRGVAMQIDAMAMERRLQNTGVDTRQNEASQIESQKNQENQPGTLADLRESIANALSSSQEEDPTPPRTQRRRRRKRPLADIIRENQLLYNDFIKNKVPRLLRQLGVETSSDDSN